MRLRISVPRGNALCGKNVKGCFHTGSGSKLKSLRRGAQTDRVFNGKEK